MAVKPPPPPGSLHWSVSGHQDTAAWNFGLWLITHATRDPSFSELHSVHEDFLLIAVNLIQDCVASDVTSDVSRFAYYGFTGNITEKLFWDEGGSRGTGEAAAIAINITWRVHDFGRGVSGHTFLPAPAATDVLLGNQLDPGAHSHINGEVGEFLSLLPTVAVPFGGPLEVGVLHRRKNGAYLPSPQLRPIDGYRVGTRLATQVKRLHDVQLA